MECLKNTFSVFHTCSWLHLVCLLDRNITASTTESCRQIKIKVSCIHCLCCTIYKSFGLKFSYCASILVFAFGRIRLQYSLPKIQ